RQSDSDVLVGQIINDSLPDRIPHSGLIRRQSACDAIGRQNRQSRAFSRRILQNLVFTQNETVIDNTYKKEQQDWNNHRKLDDYGATLIFTSVLTRLSHYY